MVIVMQKNIFGINPKIFLKLFWKEQRELRPGSACNGSGSPITFYHQWWESQKA